jgi:hypothetical protein
LVSLILQPTRLEHRLIVALGWPAHKGGHKIWMTGGGFSLAAHQGLTQPLSIITSRVGR